MFLKEIKHLCFTLISVFVKLVHFASSLATFNTWWAAKENWNKLSFIKFEYMSPIKLRKSLYLLQCLQWLMPILSLSHSKRWSNVSEKHGHQFHCQHFNILSALCLSDWKWSLKINETSFRTNSGQWTAISLAVNVFRYVVVLFFGDVI